MGLESLPDLRPPPDRDVLSVCGGGYAGLFATEVLRRLEETTGHHCRGMFDLVAGTSIGGVVILGLAHGVAAGRLSHLVREVGPSLFSGRMPGITRARHGTAPLRRELDGIFGRARLRDLALPVLVPAVDLTSGRVVVFGNHPGDPTRGERIVDVALATSAAPVYLGPHVADHRMYADGGLAANSPEALAAVDVVHTRGWDPGRTTMFVVGTTLEETRIPGHLIGAGWGLARWLAHGRLMTTTLGAQASLARRTSRAILGNDRVIVADDRLTADEARAIGLDKADRRATQALETLAATSFATLNADHAPYLRRLARRGAEPLQMPPA